METDRSTSQKKSLNFLVKKKEAERIDEENAVILKRLQKVKPTTSITANQLKKDYDKVKVLKNAREGKSNRHLDITKIIQKTQAKSQQAGHIAFKRLS